MAFHNVNQADTLADLKTLVAADGQIMILWSNTTLGDISPYWYIYVSSSSATDNYPDVVKPTAVVGNGRYIRTDLNQVQPDWSEGNSAALAYVRNKPTIPSTTTQISEGTNLYYTSGRFNTAFSGKSTTDLAEGTNQYFTNARARTSLSQGAGIGYNSSTGVITNSAPDQTVVISGATGTYPNFSIPSTARTTSTQSMSLVGTGATGTQISSTKDSTVRFTVSTSTTSTIGGPATSIVTLKKCATNDATEANWTTVGLIESDQTITLAVVLQSLQVVRGQICADIPAGWFVKLVNTGTGTHSESFISGEKTIYG